MPPLRAGVSPSHQGKAFTAMTEARDLFTVLRLSADADIVDAIQQLVDEGSDRDLCRINVLALAAKHGFDEERTIAAFLHAASLGLFDISWNVLCPGCGGVLETNATLKTVTKDEYECALCAHNYRPTLDEMVEVTFTVSPRVRRIAGHNPHELPLSEYLRQMYWGSGVDLPEDGYEDIVERVIIESIELPPGEKVVLSLQLPPKFIIVSDVVTHTVQFIDVKASRRASARDCRCSMTASTATTRRWRCDLARCASPSRTGPTRACCPQCSSPTTSCTNF